MLRIVLDTNCAIAGLVWAGAPAGILSLVQKRQIELYACDATLSEFRRVAAYPRLARHIERRNLTVAFVVKEFERLCTFVPDPVVRDDVGPIVDDDPDDDVFLHLALGIGAPYIISRDTHLLELGDYEGVKVIPPGLFMSSYRQVQTGSESPRGLWARLRWPRRRHH